jgi:glycosyltransferase involved in cell wall biosynthesis
VTNCGRPPIALVSSLLHFPAMVGYNRYSVSLARELALCAPGELAWVPLPAGVHPTIRSQLPGTVLPSVRRGWLPRSFDWAGVERRLRPALWHVLTDLPVPLFVRAPVVVTCHGLPRWYRHRHMVLDGLLAGTFWDYQDFPRGRCARRAMAREWAATKLGLWRATAVLADSEYVRWELVNKFGVRADKIHLVRLAPDPVFVRSRTPAEVEVVRAKYGLPPRFALAVASFSRTKNTAGLLKLAGGLAEAGLPPMVLVGPAGSVAQYTRQAEAGRLVPGKTVFLLHNIPDDDLACVYRAADVFVNLAWEESFALPIVEAMASGTAVVGSDRTAVPEIVGAGSLVVNPADPDAVFRTVRGVLTDANLRADLEARARVRATDFSWEKAARETAAIYDQVLAPR